MEQTNNKNSPQGSNPSGIWQNSWSRKLEEILYDLKMFDHMQAWNDLEDFKTILPPICEKDIEQLFTETKNTVFKTQKYSTIPHINIQQKQKYRDNIVIPAERKLLTAIKNSLFDRGWINKDFNIKPFYGSGKF